MTELLLSYDDIAAAHARIMNVAHHTPVMTSQTIDEKTGAQCFFKCENFQRAGAFKFRGAYNALSQFSEIQRQKGVVAFSSGNHAQAIALSARMLGIRAVIIMPHDAPAIKMAATRGYGGKVVLYDRYKEDREAIGQKYAEEQGMTVIPPFDHLHVMAGQGTCAKELFESVGALDFLFVPLGGGGLLSGCATAAQHLSPGCAVYGVEPQAGNDGQMSLRSGKIIKIETPVTIADGAQTQAIGKFVFPVLQQRVRDILTASDEALVETMKFLAERMKIMVEPTGCLSAAAALSGEIDLRGKRVGIILSGGNIDLNRFASLIGNAI